MNKQEHYPFGRTPLRTTAMGLGGGGHSRLGTATGHSRDHAVTLVRQAYDHGITTFDTAEGYGTEPVLGEAIKGIRDEITLCSKASAFHWEEKRLRTPEEYRSAIENSLRNLEVEQIDLYQFHGLRCEHYEQAVETLLPVMQQAKRDGKIRAIGITEAFEREPRHEMLERASQDDCWDSYMVGFNIANQTARESVFQHAIRKRIAILGMFAVRRAWNSIETAVATLSTHPEGARLAPEGQSIRGWLDSLIERSGSRDLAELGYRFSLAEPAITCVLFGTGSPDHLSRNVRAMDLPALDPAIYEEIQSAFSRLTDLTGNESGGS